MSRIKILLLLLIVAVLTIVFIQNRQLIALKILCADNSQPCLYQTPSLPLSVWIAIATLTGAIANLLVQTLNRYGYSDSRRKKILLNDDLYPDDKGWKNTTGDRSRYSTTTGLEGSARDEISDAKSYEIKQEPQNIERSGSTYSYKYREAGDRPKRDSIKNNSSESQTNINATTESDDEDWI